MMSDIQTHDGWGFVREVTMPAVECFRLEYRMADMWCHVVLPHKSLKAARDREMECGRLWVAQEVARQLDQAKRELIERQAAAEYARMC